MLFKLLTNVFRQLRDRPSRNGNIKIVCATRMSEPSFWTESSMGISLTKLKKKSNRICWEISFENKAGLPKVYNRAIIKSNQKETLVFVHDDVWLNEDTFINTLDEGLARYNIVGVAGNTRIVKNQPAWVFKSIENSAFVWDWGHLSGAVWHVEKEQQPYVIEYGPLAACELLDGVFIACPAHILKSRKIRFDELFDFHFYDIDFCRTARAAGLILGTWGIQLIHESNGSFGSPAWFRNFETYQSKWASEK